MAELRECALNLLARREHSATELLRKLQLRGYGTTEINELIAELKSAHLLSEQRFIEAYVTMRIRRGYGPVRIVQELRERGINAQEAQKFIDQLNIDWVACAEAVRQKKFRKTESSDFSEKIKQKKFLQYRGFSVF